MQEGTLIKVNVTVGERCGNSYLQARGQRGTISKAVFEIGRTVTIAKVTVTVGRIGTITKVTATVGDTAGNYYTSKSYNLQGRL